MTTIHKYPVLIEDAFTYELPTGARFLSVQTQNDMPQMWWLVDPAQPRQQRHFRVHGMGNPVVYAKSLTHLGTFLVHGGMFVWHLFEYVQP